METKNFTVIMLLTLFNITHANIFNLDIYKKPHGLSFTKRSATMSENNAHSALWQFILFRYFRLLATLSASFYAFLKQWLLPSPCSDCRGQTIILFLKNFENLCLLIKAVSFLTCEP